MQTTLDIEFETPALEVQEFEDAIMPVWFSGKDYITTLRPGDKVYVCELDNGNYDEIFEFVAYNALTDASCFIKNENEERLVHTRVITNVNPIV